MQSLIRVTTFIVFTTLVAIVVAIMLWPLWSRASSGTNFKLQIEDQSTSEVGGGGTSQQQDGVAGALTLSGFTAPRSSVHIYKEGEAIAEVTSRDDGGFRATFSDVGPGSYVMGVTTVDPYGRESSMMNVSVSMSQGEKKSVDMGVVAPTVAVERDYSIGNRTVAVRGMGVPGYQILMALRNNSGTTIDEFVTGISDLGEYERIIALEDYPGGVYQVVVSYTLHSNSRSTTQMFVDEKGVIREELICKRADLNCDGRVNLVDFSIAAYWYNRVLSPEVREIEFSRLSGDGLITLKDFSIMAFYWNE